MSKFRKTWKKSVNIDFSINSNLLQNQVQTMYTLKVSKFRTTWEQMGKYQILLFWILTNLNYRLSTEEQL